MENADLIRLMQDRPEEGLKIAIDLYSPLVATIVKRVLYQSPQDVEECVAETFVKFWEAARNLDPSTTSVKAYLVTIARNTAINRYHYLKRRGTVPIEEKEDQLSDKINLEAEVLAKQDAEVLMDLLEDLPEPNREIFIRRFLYFEPMKEIAEKIGLSVSAVLSRIQYYKEQLRQSLISKGVLEP